MKRINNKDAYNTWAETYDETTNKTRDLEAVAFQDMVKNIVFENALELGCGTGKNTSWLSTKATALVAADFSEEMMNVAKSKLNSAQIDFRSADIREPWKFEKDFFDLVTFSLILEHIKELDHIFHESNDVLKKNGYLYIGELHPFKQYSGSKARFETSGGIQELDCFTHHISDYFNAAKKNDFECVEMKEWFDDDDNHRIPRILTMLFRKR